jgi:hypothetical protein
MGWLGKFREFSRQEFSAANCERELEGYYRDLLTLTPAAKFRDEIGADAAGANRAFFEARQELREALYRLYRAGALEESCVDQARGVMRVLRYAEEYVGLHWIEPKAYDPKRPYPYLSGERPYLHAASEKGSFTPSDLKSGDIILSRGNAFASAAIARMANLDGQFSHAAFIHVDSVTQKTRVLEAHIEVGSTIRDYEEYARDGNFRAMVLRMREPEDRELAARAAKLAYERLSAAAASPAKAVPYDFGMDLADEREFFCTEIPYYGFHKASAGAVQVPLFQSKVEPKNRDFVDRLGIKAARSFFPSDLDVDPRFEVLAEWKDVSRVSATQRKDAVLDRFYAWGDEQGYKLHGNLESCFKKNVVYGLRRMPLFSRLLKGKFPLNMSRSVLEVISLLDDLGVVLDEEVEKADAKVLKARGLRLTLSEMEQVLDEFLWI